jgi:hypothetical protein
MAEAIEPQEQAEVEESTRSRSESGHAKNVANFDTLITYVLGYGTTYNPSKPSLKLAALQALSTSAKGTINGVNAALPAYSNAVAARETAFAPLSKLTTRVMNALRATDTTESVDENARTLVRKIQGVRATPKKSEEEKMALKAEGKEVSEVSSSQMSYDNRLDNLDKLIKLVSSIALYAPNEADLKVAALTALYTDLKAKNTAVIAATAPLSNARIARNDVLYKPLTGLYDIAIDAKTYIKSVFGATSPQYKQVKGLLFTEKR